MVIFHNYVVVSSCGTLTVIHTQIMHSLKSRIPNPSNGIRTLLTRGGIVLAVLATPLANLALGTSIANAANQVARPLAAPANDPGLLISEFLANPSGNDAALEFVELIATKAINFSVTPYSVVWTNNGTATAAGWVASGTTSYGFNINSGSVVTGDVVYVGGSQMAINGTKLRVINVTNTAGDGFGSAVATAGILGNSGANADSIGVFNVAVTSLTNASVPVDAIFFGTGTGTAIVSAGTAGYQLPVNDIQRGQTAKRKLFSA